MSRTMSTGVVGPSYWSYMAAVMAGRLSNIIQAKSIKEGDIPTGVYKDSVAFFDLALQATNNFLPANPPASVNAFTIAVEVVKNSVSSVPSEEIESYLEKYHRFVNNLHDPRNLNEEELEVARSLRMFFLKLQQAGEFETHKRMVQSDMPSARYCLSR